jgi:hypothetical protein
VEVTNPGGRHKFCLTVRVEGKTMDRWHSDLSSAQDQMQITVEQAILQGWTAVQLKKL